MTASGNHIQFGSVPNDLIFCEMLPATNFLLTGDYYPKGVFCDKHLFLTHGWQACFTAAGQVAPWTGGRTAFSHAARELAEAVNAPDTSLQFSIAALC